MDARVRIVVVDDHAVVRRGIIETLCEAPEFEVVGEGASADEALMLVARLEPDLCLLDVTMPGCGIDAARRIRRAHPDVLTLMFSYHDSSATKADALAAGASGFVVKGVSGTELKDTVRSVVQARRLGDGIGVVA